ncbi:MAG: hypothetical protein EBT63_05475 [Proteobacteria bacterium]|nr:hypothetical protein [Pseudomonadota bacterium]NCA29063.1 hypothetical protein [Pseudomonadota bacterium]
MNPNIIVPSLTRIVAPIIFSAISTALSSALAVAIFQTKFTNAEEARTQTSKGNELLTGHEVENIFRNLISRYNSFQQNYNNFKIESISKSKMLCFAGSNLSSSIDPFGNTPLTRLVANQRFGLVKAIMNEVGDQELLKAHPALTKRFLDASDKNGINFLEMSSRFYGVMPEELLKKVVSLYAENAEPESIKLTPAILSLPEKLFNSLLPKINKTNMEEFTNPNVSEKKIYDKIVNSRNEVGLSEKVIYVKEGLENSVLANYRPENDGLPDQSGQGEVTSDYIFFKPQLRSGTIASKELSEQDPENISKQINRPDLSIDDQKALTRALLNKNLPSAIMAGKNAKVNIQNLLKLDVCPSVSPSPKEFSKVVNNDKVPQI